MTTNKCRRVKAGEVTLADLASTDPVYVTGLSPYYEDVKFFENKYGSFECGSVLPEQSRYALVEALKSWDVSTHNYKTFMKGLTAGELFKKLLTVDQIGFKRAVLFTIAIKNVMPPVDYIFASTVYDVLFEGSSLSDPNDSLYSIRSRCLGDMDTRVVTKLARSVAEEMSESLIAENRNLKQLPTVEDVVGKVFDGGIEYFDNGKFCMSNRIFNTERWLFDLISKEIEHDKVTLSDYESKMLGNDQKKALVGILQANGVSCLQGMPGSGKTQVIDALYHHVEAGSMCTTAWSNKACMVLTHRLSDYKLGKDDRVKNILSLFYRLGNKDVCKAMSGVKYLVIDESSMIGSRTMYYIRAIFEKCHKDCRLVLVGDVNQLPPVKEYGRPFKVLVGLQQVLKSQVFSLETFRRSSAEGIFRAFSAMMNAGLHDIKTHEDGTVSLAKARTEAIAISELSRYIIGLEKEKKGVFAVAETNALCDSINLKVACSIYGKEHLTLRKFDPEKVAFSAKHVIPDKVGMHVVSVHNIRTNQGEILFSNNETGRVISNEQGHVTVKSDVTHLARTFDLKQFAEHFQLAYCSSVFKFQGSEEDTVVYLFDSDKNLNGYSLFHKIREQKYVALSRPRKHLRIVAICSNLDDEFTEVDSITVSVVDTPMPNSYILANT
jgi:hypothetical protein